MHIRCDMFHEEEREVPSAAIIYIIHIKERINLDRPKEKLSTLLTFTSGSLFITFLIHARGSGG